MQPFGVYIHFPWCLAKCPYCDFLSVAAPRNEIPQRAYTEQVLAELNARLAALDRPESLELVSIFFGGGTPSLWDSEQLGRVVGAVTQAFPCHSPQGVEVTAECNPSSFDARKAESLAAAGVNRVSIGVQGLADDRLEFLGRWHAASDGLRALREAVASPVSQVSADLIFGVTKQAPEVAAAEAQAVAELGVDHLSAYALTIEPGTRFGALDRKGQLPLLEDDLVARSFEAVSTALTQRGFEHYEISNYARSAERRARHNLLYWRGQAYLGLGCGAYGTVPTPCGVVRYRTCPSPDRYLSVDWERVDLSQAGPHQSDFEPIDADTALSERLMLGLRLAEGVDFEGEAERLGVEVWTRERRHAVDELLSEQRLQRVAGRLRIPATHWLFADAIVRRVM